MLKAFMIQFGLLGISRVDCDDVFAVARVFCLGSVGGEIDLEKMKRE